MPEPTIADLHVLIVTVKEAAEIQSGRIDSIDARLGNVETRLGNVETRLGNVETRLGNLERRVERGFDRVDERFGILEERFDALTGEMRRGFEEIARAMRRRGPKRDD